MAGASLDWRGWSLVIAVALAVCGFQLGGARALTEHEIYVAGGAKQMALEGGWLLPKIGDHFWLEKPPLLHWLAAVSATLCGGFSEAAVRLPSALAGVGVVGLMTALSARWFGAQVGMVTGLVQSTTVYFLTYARLAEADMLLTLIVVAALFLFARLQSIGRAGVPGAIPKFGGAFLGAGRVEQPGERPGLWCGADPHTLPRLAALAARPGRMASDDFSAGISPRVGDWRLAGRSSPPGRNQKRARSGGC